ncbi:MAG: hypothetical protein KTR18_01700 [Acidiferrobacterales bacterium]|nr:hypothetical protein [Acidiferrobacterales bacterium]
MTILETLNILLFFTHIAALLTCVSTVIYFLSIWVSGRHRSASLFPFPEVELCTKILGFALSSLWLTSLPAVLMESLAPARYYSNTGIILLSIFTMVAALALYLLLVVQNRLSQSGYGAVGAGMHAGFRLVSAGLIAVLIPILILLLPKTLFPPAYAVLNPNDILLEVLMAFGFLLLLFWAISMMLKDSWFDRSRSGQ